MSEKAYKRKDGRYEARLPLGTGENGKRRYRSFYGRTREEAELKLAAELDKRRIKPSSTEMSVRELMAEYLDSLAPGLKESSLANYRMKCRRHIIPRLGSLKCGEVTPRDISAFIAAGLRSGLSARYVSDITILLKSAFRYADRMYGIRNPAGSIIMPKKPKREITVLTRPEQARLLRCVGSCPDKASLGIAMSLYTGIRIGEACALQWKDIDLKSRTVTIRKTVQRIQDTTGCKKTKIVITEPKSESSIRVIPIPECLTGMLRMHKNKPDVYLLSDSTKPVEPRTMQYRFAAVLKKAKLPSVHFHSLRHAFATNCIALGFDVKTLSEILGHSSVEITLNRYVHSSMERKRKYMDLLSWSA